MTVPTPPPLAWRRSSSSRNPERRRAAILEESRTFLGRPSFLPLARAFLRPALTLSAIRLRSSSATAPRTVKTIFPVRAGVHLFGKGNKLDPTAP